METKIDKMDAPFLNRVSAAGLEMENPKKRAENPHYSSKFANLADTMDVIEPVMAEYGLGHIFVFDGTTLVYRVFCLAEPESLFQDSRIDLADVLQGLSGNVWQQIGQSFTYLRRYLSQAFWNLVPADNDAQSAPQRKATKPAAKRKIDRTPVDRHGDGYDVGAQQNESDAAMRAAAGESL
jgi:hypothetical protein